MQTSTTTVDPHAGHIMTTTTVDPHAGHIMTTTTVDPHAGHIMTTGMDHGNHGDSMSMMMVMHAGYKEIIVFQGWETKNVGALIGSCFALMFIAIAYEGIKFLRDKFLESRSKKIPNIIFATNESGKSKDIHKFSINDIPKHKQTYLQKLFSIEHVIETLLYVLQFTIGYFIMLSVMTYNYWICLAIIVGISIGYFFFGVRRDKIDLNEDCH